MEDLLLQLSNLPSWQICLLASYLLLQGFILTIFPEEVIISTLGLLWFEGKVDFVPAFVAVIIGLIPANAATVFLGDRFGARLLKVRPFIWFISQEEVAAGLERIRKHGKWVVIVTRFIPIIRGPIYFAAGASKFGIFRFMRMDALAMCVQVPLWMWIGRSIGISVEGLMPGYNRIGFLLLAILGGALLYKIVSSLRST